MADLLGKEEKRRIYRRSFGMRGELHAGGSTKEIVGDPRWTVIGGPTSVRLLWGIRCVARTTLGRSTSEEEKGGKVHVECY